MSYVREAQQTNNKRIQRDSHAFWIQSEVKYQGTGYFSYETRLVPYPVFLEIHHPLKSNGNIYFYLRRLW